MKNIWLIDVNYTFISANNSLRQTIKKALGREVKLGESVFLPEYEEEK